MRSTKFGLGTIIIALVALMGCPPARVFAQPSQIAGLAAPCFIKLPEIYMVINGTRHHIVDWDTFLNLGFAQADIVPCGDAANDPEGTPITRLIKGSTDPVYWMENGLRRHIPDMDTLTTMFGSLNLQTSDITILPDSVVALWPLGAPLTSIDPTPKVYKSLVLGSSTVQLWHSGALTDFATISTPHQPDITVKDVEGLGQLPRQDITGQGHPAVMFLIHFPGSHCCIGTAIYDLGPIPKPILQIESTGDDTVAFNVGNLVIGTGYGVFKDLAGDGHYEFITADPLLAVPCSQEVVMVVLRYDAAQGQFVGASPQFASYYSDVLAQLQAEAAKSTGTFCEAVPLVSTLLTIGKVSDAQAAFNQLYHGSDAQALWTQLQAAVEQSRFYAAAA